MSGNEETGMAAGARDGARRIPDGGSTGLLHRRAVRRRAVSGMVSAVTAMGCLGLVGLAGEGTASADPGPAAVAPRAAGWQRTPVPVPYGNLLALGRGGTAGPVWATGFSLSDDQNETLAATAVRWNGTAWVRTAVPVQGSGPDGSVQSRLDSPVAGAAADDLWAVGDVQESSGGVQALIEHWDGRSWKQTPSDVLPDGSQLYGLAAVSADDVWAGGDIAGRAGFAHWNGHKWSPVTPAALGGLNPISYVASVSAAGPSDVWAVGPIGLSVHYDGHSWKKVPLPAFGGDEVWLQNVRTDSVYGTWAVGYRVGDDHVRKALALHFTGGAWKVVPVPNAADTQLQDVAFTDSGPQAYGYVDSATKFGAYGVRLPAAAGGTATEIAMPVQATTVYGALSSPDRTRVWAVGTAVSTSPSLFPPFAARSTAGS